MCGIAGHVSFDHFPADVHGMHAVLNSIRHRGPDDEGVYAFTEGVFGHRRLSILDTEHSRQPLISRDRRFVIIFNGEIYNYLELRTQLEKAGVVFTTQGDTEVLLNLYIRFQEHCLSMLNGMFAFSIWDNEKKQLFMARDRLGKKPLYYSQGEYGLCFCSEIVGMFQFSFPIPNDINQSALEEYFLYQFISGAKTIYQQIVQLPPAHYFILTANHVQLSRYWSLPKPEKATALQPAAETLTELFSDAVKLRMRSDVPIGCFLSGGLDSAMVTHFLSRFTSNIKTFSIGFEQGSFDESAYTKQSASLLGVDLDLKKLDVDVADLLPKIVSHIGQPFADTSIVPTWLLCEHASQHVKVVLGGDGADELFGGYKRYLAAQLSRYFLLAPNRFTTQFCRQLLSILPDSHQYYGGSTAKKMRLFLGFLLRMLEDPKDLTPKVFNNAERAALFTPDWAFQDACDDRQTYGIGHLQPAEQLMYVDAHKYLPDDILVKTDRLSMAHGLELRSPFLDYRLVEFASRLPRQFKIAFFKQKRLLLHAMRTHLPMPILQRKKHGFASPVSNWLCHELKTPFQDLVLAQPFEHINHKALNTLWDEHQSRSRDNGLKLWTILIYAYWREYVRVQ